MSSKPGSKSPAPSTPTVIDMLKKHTWASLEKRHPKIIFVKDTDNIEHLTKTLIDADIHSVPVIGEDKAVHGIVDWGDVMGHILRLHKDNLVSKWSGALVKTLLPFQKKKYQPMKAEASLFDIATALVSSPEVNHVPIVNDKKEVVYVARASALIRWLSKQSVENPHAFGILGQTVEGSKVGIKKVVSIFPEMKVHDGFAVLWDKSISGVPIVDPDHQLSGSLSTSDIRGVVEDGTSGLDMPVEEFVFAQRRKNKKDVVPVVHVSAKDSLMKCLERILKVHIHRLYVVDNPGNSIGGGKMIGVVTQEDILRFLVNSAKPGATPSRSTASKPTKK